MRLPKLVLAGLSAACLVSSCASIPSTPGVTATENPSSSRYKLFTLENECPPVVCNAAAGSGTGGIGGTIAEFSFSFSAVDRQPGPDLLELEFVLNNETYYASSGDVTVYTSTGEVSITATPSNGTDTIDVQIRFYTQNGDIDVWVDQEAGAGLGRGVIFEGECDLPQTQS